MSIANKIGVDADTVRGYNEAFGTAGHYGDDWNGSLERIDYVYSILHDIGVTVVREWWTPRAYWATGAWGTSWFNSQGGQGNPPLNITEYDGWEAVDRVIYNCKKYGIKVVWSLPAPWGDGTWTPNDNTFAEITANWMLPVSTFFGNRHKNDYPYIEAVEMWNEFNWSLCYGIASDASPKDGSALDPRWMDMQVKVYDTIKANAPNIRVALGSILEMEWSSNVYACNALGMLDQMATRDIGFGAGKCNATQRFIDKFDDRVHLSMYPAESKLVSPNFYDTTSIALGGGGYRDIAAIKTKCISYGRSDVNVGITEFSPFWTTTGLVSVTQGQKNIIGTNTAFQSEFVTGGRIRIIGDLTVYIIQSITSNTAMTITSNFNGPTQTASQVLNYDDEVKSAACITWLSSKATVDPNLDWALYWNFWGSDRNQSNFNSQFAQTGQGLVAEDSKRRFLSYEALAGLNQQIVPIPTLLDPTIINSLPTVSVVAKNIDVNEIITLEYSVDGIIWNTLSDSVILTSGTISNGTWQVIPSLEHLPYANIQFKLKTNKSDIDYLSPSTSFDISSVDTVHLTYISPPNEIQKEPFILTGTCSYGSTIQISSDTNITFGNIVYDRSTLPMHNWSCTIDQMNTGINTITITATEGI